MRIGWCGHLLVLLSPLAVMAQSLTNQYVIEEGQPHPDFLLPEIEQGQLTQLSQFRGKKVLLLHFASW